MWAPLVELVTKTARLIRVDFSFPTTHFPLTLLDALQTHHPQVKLYIWQQHRDEELDHTDVAEQALAVSPILRGIKANAWYNGQHMAIDLRIAAFQRIVANAPNLEYASITKGSSGCVAYHLQPEEQAREQEAAAKFFLPSRRPNTSVRRLTLDGFNLNKATLIEWGKHISLPHLEDLKCSRGLPQSTYFELAPSLLTNLKHVSLNLISARSPERTRLVDAYLSTCAPLETLSLWSWMGVVSLESILEHGGSLKRLELHERESTELNKRRGLLSVLDVRRIREGCPHLEDLTLDMDREVADWQKDIELHMELLQQIGQFGQFGRRLRRVQIYFDLGIALQTAGVNHQAASLSGSDADSPAEEDEALDCEESVEDEVDASAGHVYKGPFAPLTPEEIHKHGEQVWKIIFAEHGLVSPRELDIKWGEWERKVGSGYPAPWAFWEQRCRTHVLVRPAERDDQFGEAVVHIRGGVLTS